MFKPVFTAALVGILLRSTSAMALDTAATCEASKLGRSAQYASCRLKADSKAAKAGTMADYSKCSLAKFADAETKATDAGGSCPTTTDQATVEDYLDDCTSTASLWLAGGGGLPDTCDSDLLACEGDLSTTNADSSACTGSLATCTSDLSSTNADLGSCNTNLSATNADLGACTGSLGTCNSELAATNAGLSTCTGSLGACTSDLSSTNADLGSCNTNLSATCGDGVSGFGETCDGADLNGKTCATEAPSTPYGTLACNGSCDGLDTSGCLPRLDASPNTVIDRETGLEWERKTGTAVPDTCPAQHCITGLSRNHVNEKWTWSDLYNLSGRDYAPDGGAYMRFLASMNGDEGNDRCYAGHCDWRLPTKEELSSLPWTDPAFQPMAAGQYLSASAGSVQRVYAYSSPGTLGQTPKLNHYYVRAVRTVRGGD